MYDASVALHVAAAVVGFGVTFSYPVIQIVGERNPQALPVALDAILTISRYVAVPATIVVGVTGVYQLVDGPYGLDDAWLATGLVLYLAVMVVAIGYLAPAYRRARDAAARGSAEEYRKAMRGVAVVGTPVSLAVLAIVVLMVVKPV